jgi:4-hydroxy-3-polyprenylbenzoate decarboxylase
MKKQSILALTCGLVLVLSYCLPSAWAQEPKFTGPYDSLRDYVAAIEARGRLLRIKEMDQDKYEATAFVYRMLDELGPYKAPAILIERVKINGKWMEGPVLANIYCGWDTAAMAAGVQKVTDDQGEMYKAAIEQIASTVDENGQFKKIAPVVVDETKAPCKEVILTGEDIDLTKFPWLKSNPGDVGRYINSGSVMMEDPELGRNVGTYRCQVKAKKKIGINTERGQHGWSFMIRAKRRGEPVVKAAVALGVDPLIFSMSSSKVARLGEDELAYAGGFKGKPIELVKCETSDILVPAQAEMIIEGEIPTTEVEDEGPYGEMFGYMGLQHKNFYMNVKAVTHRKNPLFVNNFTGVSKPTYGVPSFVSSYLRLKKMLPNLVQVYRPREATGMTVLSINKRFPGEGIAAGQLVLGMAFTTKIVIVVDKDVDATDMTQVLHAVATRWQPHPATLIIPQSRGMQLDPSTAVRGVSSKIVIDATQQLSQEGGPKSWPPVSRIVLEEEAPDSLELVNKKWPEYWKDWKK